MGPAPITEEKIVARCDVLIVVHLATDALSLTHDGLDVPSLLDFRHGSLPRELPTAIGSRYHDSLARQPRPAAIRNATMLHHFPRVLLCSRLRKPKPFFVSTLSAVQQGLALTRQGSPLDLRKNQLPWKNLMIRPLWKLHHRIWISEEQQFRSHSSVSLILIKSPMHAAILS